MHPICELNKIKKAWTIIINIQRADVVSQECLMINFSQEEMSGIEDQSENLLTHKDTCVEYLKSF